MPLPVLDPTSDRVGLPLVVRCDSLRGALPNARIRSESGSGVP
jgi:hypothetical protein